jgi:hypothetical protein
MFLTHLINSAIMKPSDSSCGHLAREILESGLVKASLVTVNGKEEFEFVIKDAEIGISNGIDILHRAQISVLLQNEETAVSAASKINGGDEVLAKKFVKSLFTELSNAARRELDLEKQVANLRIQHGV